MPRVTVATTSFEIVAELTPHTIQVNVPGLLLHDRFLFAAAGPATKAADEKSVVE